MVVGDSLGQGEEVAVKVPQARFPKPDVSAGPMTEVRRSV
jgi:hypothetical protein